MKKELYKPTPREEWLSRLSASLWALGHYMDYEKDNDAIYVDIRKHILKEMIKDLKNFK